jgi:hypothetical protein
MPLGSELGADVPSEPSAPQENEDADAAAMIQDI